MRHIWHLISHFPNKGEELPRSCLQDIHHIPIEFWWLAFSCHIGAFLRHCSLAASPLRDIVTRTAPSLIIVWESSRAFLVSSEPESRAICMIDPPLAPAVSSGQLEGDIAR